MAVENRGIKEINTAPFTALSPSRRILAIKLDHRGDFLVALPALCRLRDKFKGAEIDLLTGSWNVAMAQELNIFTKIISYDFFQSVSDVAPERSADLELLIKNDLREYDWAVDLRRPPDTRFMLEQVRAKYKAGFATNSVLDQSLDIVIPQDDDLYKLGIAKKKNLLSIAHQLVALVDRIPDETFALDLFMDCPPLSAVSAEKPVIGLFPGAGQEIKRWPLEYFSELSTKILNGIPAARIFLFLAPNERKMTDGFPNDERIVPFCGSPLRELVRQLRTCACIVANNSFGAHISAFLDLQAICLYGGLETATEWQPAIGRGMRVFYSDLSCSPCHLDSLSRCNEEHLCLRQITPEFVFSRVVESIRLGSKPIGGGRQLYYSKQQIDI